MKCEICGKDILRNIQCIDYKYYHNDCIINLTKENQKLNQKYLNAVADYETTMSENQELKKQLEEYKKEIHIENINVLCPANVKCIAHKVNELINYLQHINKGENNE